MSAAVLQAIQSLTDEIERGFPARFPEIGSLPPAARDRIQRALGLGAQHLLEARLAATRPEPLSDAELGLMVQGIRLQLASLDLDLRTELDRSRWEWLARVFDEQVLPWLEQMARAGIAAIVAAIEAKYINRSSAP